MDVLRWAVAGSLFLFSAWIIAINGSIFVMGMLCNLGLRRRGVPSWIPLIGGVVGSLGCLVAPYDQIRTLWWVPFVVDWGSAPGLIYTGVAWAWWAIRERAE